MKANSHVRRTAGPRNPVPFLTRQVIRIISITLAVSAVFGLTLSSDSIQRTLAGQRTSFVIASQGSVSTISAPKPFVDPGPGTLGNFDTLGLSGTTSPTSVSPSLVAANLTFSTLTRGAGLTQGAASNAFTSSSWQTAAALVVAGNTDYYEFTMTPTAGYEFSVSALRVGLQRSSTGPAIVEVRSSADSYATSLGTFGVTTSLLTFTADLAATPDLQDRTSPLTFRFYGYGASAAGGTLRIQRVISPLMLGVEVDGTVESR